MGLTQKQIESVQIDHGIVYTNYGETNKAKLGPSRGGGEFTVDVKIRDIEFDGARGKEMGTQVTEEINAALKITILDMSMETLALAMPYAKLEGDGTTTPYSLTCNTASIGVLGVDKYLKNVTMFCKTIKGDFKQITLYNALSEGKFAFKAKPKSEGEIELEFNAHWNPQDDAKDLYDIKTIASIEA